MPAEEEGSPWQYDFHSKKLRLRNPDRGQRIKEEYLLLMSWMDDSQKALEKEWKIALNSKKTESSFWEERLGTFKKIYQSIFSEWEKRWESITKNSFFQGSSLAHQTFINSQIVRDFGKDARFLKKVTLLDRPFTDPKVVESLLLDSLGYLRYALEGAEKKAAKILKITQQTLLEDAEINRKIAAGLIEKNNWEAAKKKLQEVFERALKDSGFEEGRFLEVNGRNYRVDYYSELLARTRVREAQTAGVQRYAEESGQDLVRVSDHSTLTELCEKYEGNIYSISGKSKIYPKLEMWTPFHPNCLHVITIYIDVVSIFGYDPYNGARDSNKQESNARRETLRKEVEWKEGQRDRPPEFLPGRENAVIDSSKMGYLLENKSKAGIFSRLGFSKDNPGQLERSLRETLGGKVTQVIPTEYGIKYIIDAKIPNPNNVEREMTFVWEVREQNGNPRFVTAKPKRKG